MVNNIKLAPVFLYHSRFKLFLYLYHQSHNVPLILFLLRAYAPFFIFNYFLISSVSKALGRGFYRTVFYPSRIYNLLVGLGVYGFYRNVYTIFCFSRRGSLVNSLRAGFGSFIKHTFFSKIYPFLGTLRLLQSPTKVSYQLVDFFNHTLLESGNGIEFPVTLQNQPHNAPLFTYKYQSLLHNTRQLVFGVYYCFFCRFLRFMDVVFGAYCKEFTFSFLFYLCFFLVKLSQTFFIALVSSYNNSFITLGHFGGSSFFNTSGGCILGNKLFLRRNTTQRNITNRDKKLVGYLLRNAKAALNSYSYSFRYFYVFLGNRFRRYRKAKVSYYLYPIFFRNWRNNARCISVSSTKGIPYGKACSFKRRFRRRKRSKIKVQ